MPLKSRLHLALLVSVLSGIGSGCSSLGVCDIPAVPASRVPKEFLGRARTDMQQLSISRLRQNPPEAYQLAPGDILGVYVDQVLGEPDKAPPIHYPEKGDQPPALGFPVPVREDGTLALPLVEPINVDGMTLPQATEAVREAYTERKGILKRGDDKIIVTLMRRRKYRVLVIREEGGNNTLFNPMMPQQGLTKRGTGALVDLPAYENDVLHALSETGGLPGLDAKNEILVIRGGFADGADYDQLVANLKNGCKLPCTCDTSPVPDDPNTIRIPIRFYSENLPNFSEDDIILGSGDILYIPTREREIYYTGGAMRGGQYPIPRDYDLDVIGAISVAGGSIASGGTGVGRGGGGGLGGGGGGAFGGGGGGGMIGASPSNLIVLRKLPCGGQIPIRIDLNRALQDPSQRILVQPEDTLILRYKFVEEIYNAALNLVSFNFLFNGIGGKKF